MTIKLAELIAKMKAPTILVVGDVILDRYVWGAVERVSPEAPAQVLDVTREEDTLGGAANVAANVAALGAKVKLVGVVGPDYDAQKVKFLLKEKGIPSGGLVVDQSRPTIRKTRFMALRQQMLRVDREKRDSVSTDVERKLLAKLEKAILASDGVIVSDYGKGVLTKKLLAGIIKKARAAKKEVIVDPKGSDYSRYAGSTLITPNKKEAAEASGIEIKSEADYKKAANALFKITKAENILITRGAEGMSLFGKSGKTLHLPAEALEVFDVSGAGDTVVAATGVIFFSGSSLEEAARIANVAAAIEVGHVGAKAVSMAEVVARLKPTAKIPDKVMTQNEVAAFVSSLKGRGQSVVFTNGCFDLIHAGHIDYLTKAQAMGDALVIGLNTDRSVRRLKGSRRPLTEQADRLKTLAALSCVDAVTLFDDETPLKLIQKIQPDVLVKGGDYSPSSVVGRDVVERAGGAVRIVPLVKGRSTTALIESIVEKYR